MTAAESLREAARMCRERGAQWAEVVHGTKRNVQREQEALDIAKQLESMAVRAEKAKGRA